MNKHAPDSPSLLILIVLEFFKFCCQESHILFFVYGERHRLKLVFDKLVSTNSFSTNSFSFSTVKLAPLHRECILVLLGHWTFGALRRPPGLLVLRSTTRGPGAASRMSELIIILTGLSARTSTHTSLGELRRGQIFC